MYPNTFYRVSVKALIKDEQGRVLVVKEKQDAWDLPGGGLDHGENIIDGMKREIIEELGIADMVIGDLLFVKTAYVEHKQNWMIWIVYGVELGSTNFQLGDGVTEALFIDPESLSGSQNIFEKMVYEVTNEILKTR